ncbi:MAG TPA: nicotinate phosphoribosyltransferase [Polyangiales bacterium]|nr:nicotinate phosphoribosyltransferase [Polyangiales bacterium]
MISSLITDLYQLSMGQGYFRAGKLDDQAVFHLYFRKLPFKGGYAVAAGLECALELIERFRFEAAELDYLRSLPAADGSPLFAPDFLEYLGQLELQVDVDALPEGTLAFANEPLVRVRGPLLQCQLLETALLNMINFQTLIATKAARIVYAARGRDVLEFGLRRAQGVDGALAASRAAYIGGCSATSHVLAGQRYGIPVRGTHAHSWVMSFDDEREAFDVYADAMPKNCVFLVDTYDTLEGVRNAIEAGKRLRERGDRLLGIRLDSGDLAWLSIEARKLLDAEGFNDAAIIASNDLDEHLIESLVQQGAAISVWGVGTKLVTAYDEPAMGGVYKLSMISHGGGPLVPRIKLSEQAAKISNPGIQQVRRYKRQGRLIGDVIFDEAQGCKVPCTMIDPFDPTRQRVMSPDLLHEDLLVPVVRGGKRVDPAPTLTTIREHARRELDQLDPAVQRLVNPHEYPVGLSSELYADRVRLIQQARRVRQERW